VNVLNTEKEYRIIPASAGVLAFLWGLAVFILIIVFIPMALDEYQFTTGPGIITGVVLIIVFGILAAFGWQSRHTLFIFTGQGLRIRSGLYGRTIPREKIAVGGVKVINLDIEKEYRPQWRLNGAGLPGYSAGWFKLKNKEKALLFVTNTSRVVYIPTLDNYAVLLSVREAEEFAGAIRHW
jgi:hypothetical protein